MLGGEKGQYVNLKNLRAGCQMNSRKAGWVTHRIHDGASGSAGGWSKEARNSVNAYSARFKTNS